MLEQRAMKIVKFSTDANGYLEASAGRPVTVMVSRQFYTPGETAGGLSVFFTVLCIVDLFGVFPVVALPKTIISCGIYGIPLVVALLALQLYTAVLLGRCWLLAQELQPDIRDKNRFPYAAIAELAFGSRVGSLVIFLIDATVFGAAIPNFIFASQSMQLFWWKVSSGAVNVTYCVWMVIIGILLCPIMWLGSPKEMKSVAVTSVCVVTTVAVCVWACILMDQTSPPPAAGLLSYVPSIRDFLVAYGIMAFQFDIHPMLLTLQVDMADGRRVNSALLGGFAYTVTLSAVTTLLAALRYGSQVHSNILQGMEPSFPLYLVALLVTLQLCLSSAVSSSALFQHVEDLLKIPRSFCIQRCVIRSTIVLLGIFLGESVPRFDLIMGLVGSSLTGPLMFVFPPLFFVRLCYKKTRLRRHRLLRNKIRTGQWAAAGAGGGEQAAVRARLPLLAERQHLEYDTFATAAVDVDEYSVRWYDVTLAALVVTLGGAATLAAVYSSWGDFVDSATFTKPCLINATVAARTFVESMADS
ncbi:probable sodium-coupled neutral amino acid transporter 6 isoform X2 [Aricia agestis]|uniref:probable sodium-coupled neutral amino acid transporter 6 isoform X2 n=1 Tax=Aricia agestis TaxID=91739 RepID=UPI001C2071B1|nr:probable sodium-coupled neutral amino acid transporter 6 isoform X2 [Aricia agestis]